MPVDPQTMQAIITGCASVLERAVAELPRLFLFKRRVKELRRALEEQADRLQLLTTLAQRHTESLILLQSSLKTATNLDKSKEHLVTHVGRLASQPDALIIEGSRMDLIATVDRARNELGHAFTELAALEAIRVARDFTSFHGEEKANWLVGQIANVKQAALALQRTLDRVFTAVANAETHRDTGFLETGFPHQQYEVILFPLREIQQVLLTSLRNQFSNMHPVNIGSSHKAAGSE